MVEYHKVKEILEKSFDDEKGIYKLEKDSDDTKLNFVIKNKENFYDVLNAPNKNFRGLTTSEYIKDFHLSGKGVSIGFMYLLKGELGVYINKKGDFNEGELESIINSIKISNPLKEEISIEKRISNIGAKIYEGEMLGWDYLAGYEDIKESVKKTIILPLKNPKIYSDLVFKTRKVYEDIMPKAVLFFGPPGTGKTTMARIIASNIEKKLIYVPIESIVSKWYGESEKNLSEIFDLANDSGSLLFLDEIDSIGASRDNGIHEASRRVLSVLLRKIDGFENNKSILIGATNRKKDLDSALLNRFDLSINFRLPNKNERSLIFKNYAQQLSRDNLLVLAEKTEGYSGREIKDLCENVERSFVADILENKKIGELPELNDYLKFISQNGS